MPSPSPTQPSQLILYTQFANVTGVPALALPVGVTPAGLPVGLQLMAGAWQEGLLLAVGADALIALETRLPVRVTPGAGLTVCLLTLGMCILAGAMAIRRVAVADPAALY